MSLLPLLETTSLSPVILRNRIYTLAAFWRSWQTQRGGKATLYFIKAVLSLLFLFRFFFFLILLFSTALIMHEKMRVFD